jgi:LPXTG-site transpeptidase (sortase) family protein
MTKRPLEKTNIVGLLKEYKGLFVIYFVAIFATIFTVSYIFGMVPVELQVGPGTDKVDSSFAVSEFGYGQQGAGILPTHITIEKAQVNASIEHPQGQDVATLDAALTKGAVYYPGSGTISKGNIFLFGHSTSFRVVNNQAYKIFNGLKDLEAGDEIKLLGEDGKTYIYKVTTVNLLDDDKALVEFNTDKRMLTLSTCNTFGKKQERYVVEALFAEVI